MKKIVLKKMVIARISDNEMNYLKGGQSDNACKTALWLGTCGGVYTTYVPTPSGTSGCTCGTEWTCNGK